MKRLILYLMLLALPFVGQAQSTFKKELAVGASFGTNFSRVSFAPKVHQKMQMGFTGGLTLRWLTENHLGLQAEVNFTQQGWAEKFEEQPQYRYSRSLTGFEVPFMTHIYFGSDRFRFFVNLGPKVGYIFSESTDSNLNGATPNLNNDHAPLLDIYHAVDALPGVKRSFIGSGVRYDLAMHNNDNKRINETNRRYIEELIIKHVSGRLKVAPEHTSDSVLRLMRKPSFSLFEQFKRIFDIVNEREGLRLQLIPYFISSHPGCHEIDMAELAVKTKKLNFHLEQVQDFTPTPMTVSTEMYYTGYNPYTLEPVFTATTRDEKLAQRKYFFWYEPEYRRDIYNSLCRLGRRDIAASLFGSNTTSKRSTHKRNKYE